MRREPPSQFSLFKPQAEASSLVHDIGNQRKPSSIKAATKAAAPPTLTTKKQLLKIRDVCVIVGLSRATIYRLLKSPDAPFPKPVKVGAGSFWVEEEVIAWLNRLIETRQATIDG